MIPLTRKLTSIGGAVALAFATVATAAPAQAAEMCTTSRVNWTPTGEVVVPAGRTCTLNNPNVGVKYQWNISKVSVGEGATLIVNGGMLGNIDAKTAFSKVVVKKGANVSNVNLGRRSTLEATDSRLDNIYSWEGHSLIRMTNVDITSLQAEHGGTVTTTRARATGRFVFDDMGGTVTLSRAQGVQATYNRGRAASRFEMRSSSFNPSWGTAVEAKNGAHVVLNGNTLGGDVEVVSNRGNLFVSANRIAKTLDCYSNTMTPTFAVKNLALTKTGQCRGI